MSWDQNIAAALQGELALERVRISVFEKATGTYCGAAGCVNNIAIPVACDIIKLVKALDSADLSHYHSQGFVLGSVKFKFVGSQENYVVFKEKNTGFVVMVSGKYVILGSSENLDPERNAIIKIGDKITAWLG